MYFSALKCAAWSENTTQWEIANDNNVSLRAVGPAMVLRIPNTAKTPKSNPSFFIVCFVQRI